jgi:hypothetical protein
MKAHDSFHIEAQWGPRRETPASLAVRVAGLIERLRGIDPILTHWYTWVNGTKAEPVNFDPVSLAEEIASGVSRDDLGESEPIGGYYFSALNNKKGDPGPRGLMLLVHGGSLGQNFVGVDTDFGVTPDPDIVTYPIFKAVTLAIGETFDPVWAYAFPSSLNDLLVEVPRGRGPMLGLSWMTYISPRLSRLVTPPLSAIIERRRDGGLLMAATEETFSTSNPAHLAVANDILAAVAPINALGWPPEIK